VLRPDEVEVVESPLPFTFKEYNMECPETGVAAHCALSEEYNRLLQEHRTLIENVLQSQNVREAKEQAGQAAKRLRSSTVL